MAGSFSNYLEDELLDHVFGCNSRNWTPPTNIYVALSTADPLDGGTGLAEPSGGAYARMSTAAADWSVSSGGAVSNVNTITFPQATASWGTITHIALFDAASVGNMLAHADLNISKTIDNGDQLRIPAGDLDVTLT